MLELDTLEGQTIYLDAAEIVIVAPAYAEPDKNIPAPMRIPRLLGSQVIMRSGFKTGVKGEPETIAMKVDAARAGRPTLTN